MEKQIKLIENLSLLNAPSGFEEDIREYLKNKMEKLGQVSYDHLGSIICQKKGVESGPKIILPGHMDEIGFLVKHITKEGFIKFIPLGGWWDQVLLSQKVIVKTKKGDLAGVIGSTPPHVLEAKDREKMVRLKDMFIDIGAQSQEEAQEVFGVSLGDPIVPYSEFTQLANPNFYMGKALDNRLGTALMLEILEDFQKEEHPNIIYGVGTVQEEVGLRGAQTAANYIQPDINFTLDVAIAGDTPGLESHYLNADLGKGPVLLLADASLIPHRKLKDFVIETAQEFNIPLQLSTMTGGGTDAGSIHLAQIGVPSISFGIPTRYIHSHNSVFNINDYKNLKLLISQLIKKLDQKKVAEIKEF